ncbi:MAG: hypothetical protein FJY29_00720 [Betaproteobacteria bacterium]|nr:hypothetical protein [Betaproteobacteria bacterium]
MNPIEPSRFVFSRALALAVVSTVFLGACKSPQQSNTSATQIDAKATPSGSPQQIGRPPVRAPLSATQWLTKDKISAEEARTVDALLVTISDYGGPKGDPVAAARWGERNLQIATLGEEGLTEIAPILAFKRIVTLSIPGNKFTQDQLNELLAGLPNLKTLVKDKNLKCDTIKYPKVTCLD